MRQLLHWFDALTDWQRVRYALALIVFLLACAGYLLGLGSTVVLQRVEAEEQAMAAQPLDLSTPDAEPTVEAVALAQAPTFSPPTATATLPPTATPVPPTPTPFRAPEIVERPAVPRSQPAVVPPPVRAPVVVPPTATAKPRNVESPTLV